MRPYRRLAWHGPAEPAPWLDTERPLRLYCARSFAARFLGLRLWPGWGERPRGLLLPGCRAVHTLGLARAVDLVFLDAEGVVRGVYRGHAQPELLQTLVKAAFDAAPHGELPVVLRTVSHIPRERVLTVYDDEDGLRFEGRSLRCDVSYCAETAARGAVSAASGVVEVMFNEAGGTDRTMLEMTSVSGALTQLGLSRLLRGLVYGIGVTDPITFIGATTVLLAVALLASWIPATRASRVDPIVALRAD